MAEPLEAELPTAASLAAGLLTVRSLEAESQASVPVPPVGSLQNTK